MDCKLPQMGKPQGSAVLYISFTLFYCLFILRIAQMFP